MQKGAACLPRGDDFVARVADILGSHVSPKDFDRFAINSSSVRMIDAFLPLKRHTKRTEK